MAIFASANGQPLMCARLKRTQEDKCALIRKVGTAFAPDCFLLSLHCKYVQFLIVSHFPLYGLHLLALYSPM